MLSQNITKKLLICLVFLSHAHIPFLNDKVNVINVMARLRIRMDVAP